MVKINFNTMTIERSLKKIDFTSYNPIAIILRLLLSLAVASIVLTLMVFSADSAEAYSQLDSSAYFFMGGAFTILVEGMILIDRLLERYLPIPMNIRLRIVLQVLLGAVLSIAIILGIGYLTPSSVNIPRFIIVVGASTGSIFMFMIASILVVMRFTENWIKAQRELSQVKQDKLKMDYSQLQDQLNPHFLFNNLSVLKSLVIYDKDKAVTFIENFTDVYRYVLKSKDKMLVDLKEEFEFINAFIALHRERMGEGFDVEFSILDDAMTKQIAPLTLQLLIENAIKHNVASRKEPLTIRVLADESTISVTNNLKPKQTSYSTQTGLKNLVKRYEMISQSDVKITISTTEFSVSVPLL